jgi:2-polyprenyl-3-methyl-5-hydroxy-6-metoxy-1,4-benzoquinol methylase
MIDIKTCPVCGSENNRIVRQATFDPAQIDSRDFRITDNRYGHCWTFKRCGACRTVFADPAPDPDDLISFYSALDDQAYGQEADGRAKNFQTILRRLASMLTPGSRILDIGSANGLFVHLCRQAGYQAEGIEPSTALVAEAQSRYGVKLFHGTLEAFSSTVPFRAVTLLDLIEHLSDPIAFLTRVNGLMEEGGTLVIVTPDIDSPTARLLKRRWWHHRIAHINFYPLPALKELLSRCGFALRQKKRYAWHFSAFYLVSRLVPLRFIPSGLQRLLKKINLKVQLFDSWEIYAEKERSIS